MSRAAPPAPPPTGSPRWSQRTVCVAGLGVSGAAAAETLLRLGARVLVVEGRDGEPERRRAAALTALGARVLLGYDPARGCPPVDLVVTSPGWRPSQPVLMAATAAGVPVWGEVELAWRLRPPEAAPWLALTGTNGKTTTVRMLAAMLAAAGHRTVAAGNVGTPLLSAVLADPPYDVVAVELSSFQLHWSSSLRPYAGAVLNLAPDHLDWHGSFEAYLADKARIWAASVRICNGDDPPTARLLPSASGPRVTFTLAAPGPGQLGVLDGLLVDRAFTGGPLAAVSQVRPAGPHNVANALAAAALALSFGVPVAAVAAGLRDYRPDPHRNALVATVEGVAYVDDSKATNPHAAAASLAAYPSVVWVAGGLGKGASFDELVVGAAGRLRAAVLFGQCRAELAAALARHAPEVPVVELATTETGTVPQLMSDAVARARALARPADTVLLAPAAASMDLFADYGERGRCFAAAVRELAERAR